MKIKNLCVCVLMAFVLAFTSSGKVMVEASIGSLFDEVGPELTPEQIEKVAFGAVLTTRNSMHYKTLFGNVYIYKLAMTKILSDSWGVTSHDSAIDTLNWLAIEGHRASFDSNYYGYDEIYHIISGRQENHTENTFAIQKQGYEAIYQGLMNDYGYTEAELAAVQTISAWDYDRLVNVARWCYGAGYISEAEAWFYIDIAVAMARNDYDNWRAYFAGVLFGRTLWAKDGVFNSSDRGIADKLLKEADSIFNTVPFQP